MPVRRPKEEILKIILANLSAEDQAYMLEVLVHEPKLGAQLIKSVVAKAKAIKKADVGALQAIHLKERIYIDSLIKKSIT